MAITNKEIIEKLECLEARYSGTELQEIHKTVSLNKRGETTFRICNQPYIP